MLFTLTLMSIISSKDLCKTIFITVQTEKYDAIEKIKKQVLSLSFILGSDQVIQVALKLHLTGTR